MLPCSTCFVAFVCRFRSQSVTTSLSKRLFNIMLVANNNLFSRLIRVFRIRRLDSLLFVSMKSIVALLAIVMVAKAFVKECPVDPRKCPVNSDYNTCPSPCFTSCQKPVPATGCIESCDPAGCVCRDGFVKNSKNECVERFECMYILIKLLTQSPQ